MVLGGNAGSGHWHWAPGGWRGTGTGFWRAPRGSGATGAGHQWWCVGVSLFGQHGARGSRSKLYIISKTQAGLPIANPGLASTTAPHHADADVDAPAPSPQAQRIGYHWPPTTAQQHLAAVPHTARSDSAGCRGGLVLTHMVRTRSAGWGCHWCCRLRAAIWTTLGHALRLQVRAQ